MLHRREIGHLEAWAGRRPHKSVVIRGARQVGKSTLVREFARSHLGTAEPDPTVRRDVRLGQLHAVRRVAGLAPGSPWARPTSTWGGPRPRRPVELSDAIRAGGDA